MATNKTMAGVPERYLSESANGDSPVREYRTVVDKNTGGSYNTRLLIGTPTTGLVRMEWVAARYGAVIPMNWSYIQITQFINSYIPIGYMVADAQNLIVKAAIEQDMEWLLLIEHDNVIPHDAFIRFNEYMREEKTPVVSGLYFTRSRPSDPLVFRGRGTSVYDKWKMGDKVWVDGVPTGCLLVHMGILREMWKDAPEYQVNGQKVRRVFESPLDYWIDPETASFFTAGGTSDLNWCTKVMEGGYFKKAGWPAYQKKKYPFLIDTQIFCRHINQDGEQFP